ncbi:TrmH family RNA methyltransferase [Megalodesulfovibrio gigas]|uniref:tRNA (guanosine(18)-2'-O)-methyltransferase n=1 Tax=Megalodesulfovibrio gigas (strain ATCC 19364 / DSM 1382 / NCIMB 9332 / VKM B-1759) TaxID=1121448 RepID=T2GEJ9_MEGG1|nr:TrmH family RNA methyltransferase [Megalodesulfovibrio gigas]AGW14569.1 putative tRNA guanosine-2'-O-methyltransferase [Megalodesulfovibrio gigas DSM 1382 = ATCC 19364]
MTAKHRLPECITPERAAKVRRVATARQHDLTLVLANIHDPHNVSAVYRSCDAFGVSTVHLYYTDTAFPVLGRKTSASARKWVETQRHADAGAMVAGLHTQGMQVLCTACSEKARPLTDYDFTRPTAIILGNEHRGADPELQALAHDELYIPMMGMVQSLNVSVAAAIILYEAWRQRMAKGMYDASSLDDEALERLVQTWSAW